MLTEAFPAWKRIVRCCLDSNEINNDFNQFLLSITSPETGLSSEVRVDVSFVYGGLEKFLTSR